MSAHAKRLLREAAERLPEDASVEDAMERVYFLAKVARGLGPPRAAMSSRTRKSGGSFWTRSDCAREFPTGELLQGGSAAQARWPPEQLPASLTYRCVWSARPPVPDD